MNLPELTLGIEEEYQIVDRRSRELTSYVQELLEHGRLVLHDQIKPEFLKSQVEVGSHICRNVQELGAELHRLRRSICQIADDKGVLVIAASTHPFSHWLSQEVSEGERYIKLQDDLADVARQLLIFGMHIHIGIEDRELLIDVMNQCVYFLPHLLALSTSSPFWQGRNTGLKSYRSVVFQSLPRTGLPPLFESHAEYQRLVDVLVETRCIDEPSKIWWDVRPHPKFPTLEFRICDLCTRVDDALGLVALVQAIVAKLIQLRRNNQSWRRYPRHLIEENKWRALRYGLDGKLIDFGQRREVPVRQLALELLSFVDDVVDELGSRAELEHVRGILTAGTSADRQLAVWERTQNALAVVDHLAAETRSGC